MNLADFQNHLDANPMDWEIRLVFADFLDGAGDPVGANGQRWQVEKRAVSKKMGSLHCWWAYRPNIDLPVEILKEMDNPVQERMNVRYRDYKNRIDAERDLAEALAKLQIESKCNQVH